MAYDSAGNPLSRYPSVATIQSSGKYYIAANSQAASVDAEGIKVGSAWSDSTGFVVPVPNDGIIYLHYVYIDERARSRQAIFYCPVDISDAPSYPQARHTYSVDLNLGTSKDVDDPADTTDDADGVAAVPAISSLGSTYSVTTSVTAAQNATLYGWVDFDQSGTFDTGEFVSTPVSAGDTSATLNWSGLSGLPSTGSTYMRLRLTSDTLTGIDPGTAASNGEVEDNQVAFSVAAASPPALVSISASKNGVEAGNGGPIDGEFTISIPQTYPIDTVVTYTVSGSAQSGVDFTPLALTATIPAGSTSANVVVPVLPDQLSENTETLTLTLTGVTGDPNLSIIPNSAATIQIVDTLVDTIAKPLRKALQADLRHTTQMHVATASGLASEAASRLFLGVAPKHPSELKGTQTPERAINTILILASVALTP